ncbi:MAG: restriction endonuclease [Acidobacteriota bacterium]
MPETTIKRTGELVRGVFRILLDEPEGLQVKKILERLEVEVPPTEFERGLYPSTNRRRYDNIVRFSTIVSVKAGWLEKEKGTWSLTDEGRKAYQAHTSPEEFQREATRLYNEWAKGQPDKDGGEEAGNGEQPDDASLLEEAEETAWSRIQSHLGRMNPYDFQDLVSGLLRGMGYHVNWVSPPGPDRGVDIIAHTDPLGVSGPRIKVQVKRRADKINSESVRSFIGILAEDDIGLFVSTGGFTRDAEAEVRSQEKRKMMLVDLNRLFDLWVEHYDRIPEAQRRLLPLRPIHYLAPAD